MWEAMREEVFARVGPKTSELLRVLAKRRNNDEDIINARNSAEVELNLLKLCSIFVLREFWKPLLYSVACSTLKSSSQTRIKEVS